MNRLFSTSVYEQKLNLDVDKMTKHFLSMKRKEKGIKKSNIGGWHSPILRNNYTPLNSLFDEILRVADDYRKILSYKWPLKIDASWVIINGYKDYNIEHTHPDSILSGAYYLTSNNSGITFINPSADVMSYTLDNNDIKDFNEHNCSTYTIEPSKNTLLLFPSLLKHRVEPNLSKKNRICISFNLGKGIYPSMGL